MVLEQLCRDHRRPCLSATVMTGFHLAQPVHRDDSDSTPTSAASGKSSEAFQWVLSGPGRNHVDHLAPLEPVYQPGGEGVSAMAAGLAVLEELAAGNLNSLQIPRCQLETGMRTASAGVDVQWQRELDPCSAAISLRVLCSGIPDALPCRPATGSARFSTECSTPASLAPSQFRSRVHFRRSHPRTTLSPQFGQPPRCSGPSRIGGPPLQKFRNPICSSNPKPRCHHPQSRRPPTLGFRTVGWGWSLGPRGEHSLDRNGSSSPQDGVGTPDPTRKRSEEHCLQ